MPAVTSATFLTPTSIQVDFDVAMDPTTIDDVADWSVALLAGQEGASPAVVSVAVAGSNDSVVLDVHPELTPGSQYRAQAPNAATVAPVPAVPNYGDFTAPTSSAPDDEAEWPHKILQALTNAVGREFQTVYGVPRTVLLLDLDATGGLAYVESTYKWPTGGGAFWADGDRWTYASALDGALVDVAPESPRNIGLPGGTELALDVRSVEPLVDTQGISRVERAFRDTLVWAAEGDGHVELSRLYGMPKPAALDETGWREAMLANAIGARGTPGAVLAFCIGALRSWREIVEVTRDPAQPQRITATSGTPFLDDHVGRWVRIGETIYRVTGPADVVAAGKTYLELCPMKTASWAAADWSGFSVADTVDAEILAFTIREPSPGPQFNLSGDPVDTFAGIACLVEILIGTNISGVGAPPTYLRPNAIDPKPVGQPFGGHIQPDATTDGDQTVAVGAGPKPPYLPGSTVLGSVKRVLDPLLAAGVKPEFKMFWEG